MRNISIQTKGKPKPLVINYTKRLTINMMNQSILTLNTLKIKNTLITSKIFDYTDKAPQLITIEELNKIIAKCNNKTSTDVFGISSIILKNIPNSFRLILTNYFNNCLIENQIPLP